MGGGDGVDQLVQGGGGGGPLAGVLGGHRGADERVDVVQDVVGASGVMSALAEFGKGGGPVCRGVDLACGGYSELGGWRDIRRDVSREWASGDWGRARDLVFLVAVGFRLGPD